MRGTLRRVNLGFFAALTLIVSGCITIRPFDPGPGKRVAASIAQQTYLSGQPVNITIANLSEVTLVYPGGFCKAALQRRDGSAWMTIPNPSKGCPIALDFLEPGQSVVHQFHLPQGVAVGTYRLTLPMPVPEEAGARELELVTPTFREPGLLTPSFKVASSLD